MEFIKNFGIVDNEIKGTNKLIKKLTEIDKEYNQVIEIGEDEEKIKK